MRVVRSYIARSSLIKASMTICVGLNIESAVRFFHKRFKAYSDSSEMPFGIHLCRKARTDGEPSARIRSTGGGADKPR